MFKKLLTMAMLLATTTAFAAGPSQIWRLEVSQTEEGTAEIAEIEIAATPGGANLTDLIRTYSHTESVAATVWTVVHNLDVQMKMTDITVAGVDGALDPLTPTDITIIDTNTVQVTFAEVATGDVFVYGISFDTPATNKTGQSIPPVNQIENRASAAAFDNNKATWYKSDRAPSANNPLVLQYTFWLGDNSRFPNVVEYRITAKNAETAPKSWRFMYWNKTQWELAGQVAGAKFKDGETKTYTITTP